MTALDKLHTYALAELPSGGALMLFKRTDLHELTQVGTLLVMDKSVDIKEIGARVCAALDQELVTRGSL